MTLPASGAIDMGEVDVELTYASTATISLGDASVRTLAGIPSGAISLNDLHGKTFATWHRPNTYAITAVTGGSVTNPANAYDGSTSTLEGSTYTTVAHTKGGTYQQEEVVTYSGFGTGTFSGHLYVSYAGTMINGAVSAVASVGVDALGAGQLQIDSDTSTSFSGTLTVTLSSVNLATLSVAVWATGGTVTPLTDFCSSNFQVYDILVKS